MNDILHLRAPGNWINDPNGFCYYNGEYHLFYQHFPYAPRWATMHWGHAVSPDLIHWKHLGVALFPTKDYDQNGVFSGSAMEIDGRLHLYYSAVRYLQPQREDIHLAQDDHFVTSQAMAVSRDGYHFDNWEDKEQIIPVIEDPAVGDRKHTRDPKVWKEGESYRMVLGSTREETTGRVLFYRSDDGRTWTYVNQYASPELGSILECPDLAKLEEGYLFFGSPMGVTADGLSYADQAMYARADFDPDTCRMTLKDPHAFLDWGLDLYAPQSTVDEAGRRVVIGWMRMPQPVSRPGEERGEWIGMMSLPRVAQLRDGQVYFPVHPNVTACFTRPVSDLAPLGESRPVRLQTTLREGETLSLGGYRIRMEDGRVEGDRTAVFPPLPNVRLTAQTPPVQGGSCRLDIFVDPNLVEIFVNNGQYVLSHVVYGLDSKLEGRFDAIHTL